MTAALDVLSVIGIDTALAGAAKSMLETMAESFTEGSAEMFKAMTTWWVGTGTVNVATPGSQANGIATQLQGMLKPIAVFVAIISVIISSARIVLSRNARPAEETIRGLITIIVVSGAGLAAVGLLTEFSDGFSSWILTKAGVQDFKFSAGATTSAALLMMFGMLGMIVAGIQWVLMLSRDALLIVFAGVLPLAAAGTTTKTGQQFFDRVTGWTLALILYKPVAAIIYWTAMRLIRDTNDLAGGLRGLTLMGLAIVALPALMRLIVPAVGPAIGRGGGAMAAGAAVASGAVLIASGGTAAAAAPVIAGAANVAGTAAKSPIPESSGASQ